MPSRARPGRPRATTRATIAEAACELFLERGFVETTVADITRRAGVSRSSFFNYFDSKAAVLWESLDARLAAAEAALADRAPVDEALRLVVEGLVPDALSLAVTHAEAMGLVDELDRDRAMRQRTLQRSIGARLQRDGAAPLPAEVRAGALAAAVFAAVWAWADHSASESSLPALLQEALAAA